MVGMGLFHVPVRLTGPTGRSETIEALVDTGATFLVVPCALADRLELRPSRTCPALLGAVALESLLLAPDPVARRLVPVRGFVGTLPAVA
jgi:predicted aspartyl protease